MADWTSLLHRVLLADGSIDAAESRLLADEILADGVVDEEEMSFLTKLRNASDSRAAEFDEMYFEALAKSVLADGNVDADEVAMLRQVLMADGVVDDGEKAFLKRIKAEAKQTSPEFDAFYSECVG